MENYSKSLQITFIWLSLPRVCTASQWTVWTTQKHSLPQRCGWVRWDFTSTLPPLGSRPFRAVVGLCSCHQVAVRVAAHHTPGAVDVHCNQPGQRVHQGRKQTPGGENRIHFTLFRLEYFSVFIIRWIYFFIANFCNKKVDCICLIVHFQSTDAQYLNACLYQRVTWMCEVQLKSSCFSLFFCFVLPPGGTKNLFRCPVLLPTQ